MKIDVKLQKVLDEINLDTIMDAGSRLTFAQIQGALTQSMEEIDEIIEDTSLPVYVSKKLTDMYGYLLFASKVLIQVQNIVTEPCECGAKHEAVCDCNTEHGKHEKCGP